MPIPAFPPTPPPLLPWALACQALALAYAMAAMPITAAGWMRLSDTLYAGGLR